MGPEMADNVVLLHGAQERNECVIAELERLLTLARDGNLQGIAYVVSRRDHGWITGWRYAQGHSGAMASGILVLSHRFAADLASQPEADDL